MNGKLDAPDFATPGLVIGGRYRVERELGQGGMARVYLAEDLKLNRQVAIKILRPELAVALGTQRFLREIQIESGLRHPNILPLYDSGDIDGLPYYVMPYVDGESLRARLMREQQLSIEESVRVACSVADALGHAHGLGIVHRDIKPENILLTGDQVLVADFGIARGITVAAGERLTDTGMAVGTPAYMSPEQGSGTDRVDGRSDIYSLGCVVFEMLAGQPPFTGATAQAVIARHMADRPPSIEVVRPTLPQPVVLAIERCLAKVPADRFSSPAEFSAALTATTHEVAVRRRTPVLPIALASVALVAAGAWGLARVASHRAGGLDSNRVLVFPLHDATDAGAGEDVATYIGHVLDGSDPLKWEEGGPLISAAADARSGQISSERAGQLSRQRRAAYYIDGSILRQPDSVTIVLRLHDVAGDSLLKRVGRTGPLQASKARLGALAVSDLLPALLEPGRKIDVGALADRRPAAIANFLQGERAYRRTRFEEALEHYRKAVADDSAFALAAVKGAEAAAWVDEDAEAERLTQVALRGEAYLPVRYASFARGWRAYLSGAADSATSELQRATIAAPGWAEAWMALGEVYYHLLPRAASLDSLAKAAFLEAQRLDPEFWPPVYHLTEMALRKQDLVGAERLFDRLQRAGPDSTLLVSLTLAIGCAKRPLTRVEWLEKARTDYADVLEAGKILSTSTASKACAEEAFRAVLSNPNASSSHRFSALFGLHNLLVLARRVAEVRVLLASKEAAQLHAKLLYLYDAASTTDFQSEAIETARAQGADLESLGSTTLWLLGIWEARNANTGRALAIQRVLTTRADSGGAQRDRLFADIVAAHAALATGDTALAVQRLEALTPSAPRPALAWTLWDALGWERLTLATIQLEHGDPTGALQTAAVFDSQQPISYLLYLPASLALRARAAEALGDRRRAADYRTRLRAIGREDLVVARGEVRTPAQEER